MCWHCNVSDAAAACCSYSCLCFGQIRDCAVVCLSVSVDFCCFQESCLLCCTRSMIAHWQVISAVVDWDGAASPKTTRKAERRRTTTHTDGACVPRRRRARRSVQVRRRQPAPPSHIDGSSAPLLPAAERSLQNLCVWKEITGRGGRGKVRPVGLGGGKGRAMRVRSRRLPLPGAKNGGATTDRGGGLE